MMSVIVLNVMDAALAIVLVTSYSNASILTPDSFCTNVAALPFPFEIATEARNTFSPHISVDRRFREWSSFSVTALELRLGRRFANVGHGRRGLGSSEGSHDQPTVAALAVVSPTTDDWVNYGSHKFGVASTV